MSTVKDKEITVEDFLCDEVERRGGFTIKLSPKGYKGIPDRLVLLPGGVIIFIELKRPRGGVFARLQKWWRDRIRHVGAAWAICRTHEEVLQVLDEQQRGA